MTPNTIAEIQGLCLRSINPTRASGQTHESLLLARAIKRPSLRAGRYLPVAQSACREKNERRPLFKAECNGILFLSKSRFGRGSGRPESLIQRMWTMAKLTLTAIIVAALTSALAGIAQAQDNGGLVAPELTKPTPGQLLDQDYLTGTGATVPRPGVPQGSGPTPLDRSIRQQNNRIDNSICTDC
jgi:hypothetical protein